MQLPDDEEAEPEGHEAAQNRRGQTDTAFAQQPPAERDPLILVFVLDELRERA